jgi:hypothetical protein
MDNIKITMLNGDVFEISWAGSYWCVSSDNHLFYYSSLNKAIDDVLQKRFNEVKNETK